MVNACVKADKVLPSRQCYSIYFIPRALPPVTQIQPSRLMFSPHPDGQLTANGLFPSSGWILSSKSIFILAIGHFTKRPSRYFMFWNTHVLGHELSKTFSIESFPLLRYCLLFIVFCFENEYDSRWLFVMKSCKLAYKNLMTIQPSWSARPYFQNGFYGFCLFLHAAWIF